VLFTSCEMVYCFYCKVTLWGSTNTQTIYTNLLVLVWYRQTASSAILAKTLGMIENFSYIGFSIRLLSGKLMWHF